jgi:adenylyl- and sulfurtransferase ThiI
MEEFETGYNKLKEYILSLEKKIKTFEHSIKLYEKSTNLDYIKIQKQSDFIKDLEMYINQLEIDKNALNHATLEQRIKIDMLEKQNKKLDDIINKRF